MKMKFIIVSIFVFFSSMFVFAATPAQFNVVPAAHPNACNAIKLRNLASNGTTPMTWTFNPAAINAATGLPVTSLVVTAPAEPIVYWTGTPAYSSLTIGYNGKTQVFNTCDCNPFAAGSFGDAPLVCNTSHYCGNTAAAYIEDFLQNGTPAGGLGANGDGCLFCGSYTQDHQGSIENNSWLRFIANGTSASFDIVVESGCYIQFAVYEYNPTAPLGTNGVLILKTPITWTNVADGFTGTHTITATGLIPGNQYYLHFDGFGGADCDYEIGFSSGITTIDAIASAPSVCAGQAVILNAIPNDPTAAYTWTDNHGNTYANSNQIVVNPTVATTYSVSVLLPGCNNTPDNVSVGIDPCPLPVELVNFNVDCKENGNLISWETVSELNNDYFEVEKSIDGLDFRSLDIIQGAGNSNQLNYYETRDIEKNSETVYYRIRQVDIDGSENYSDIISSNDCYNNGLKIVKMYFNQATSEIVIDYEVTRTTNAYLAMSDLVGRPYLSESLTLEPNGNQIRIKANNLAGNTMYILNVSSDNTSDTERIYVNH